MTSMTTATPPSIADAPSMSTYSTRITEVSLTEPPLARTGAELAICAAHPLVEPSDGRRDYRVLGLGRDAAPMMRDRSSYPARYRVDRSLGYVTASDRTLIAEGLPASHPASGSMQSIETMP
jgi:hypothetical protein